MKLHQLFEEEQHGRLYTIDQARSLSSPSPNNIENAFRVGKTIFDNKHGFGQTPYNSSVAYFGFAMELYPHDFISIVKKQDREQDAKNIANMMLDHYSFGSPMLFVKCNLYDWADGEKLKVKITGHEGRARTLAFNKINPNKMLPVHVILGSGDRARNLSPQFFEDLKENGIITEDDPITSSPKRIRIGQIFWNYSTIN